MTRPEGSMNHRLIQKTLFRMLLDASFRERVLARDLEAEPALEPAELELLAGLDARKLGADKGDGRRRQLLGNLLSEFRLAAGCAPRTWSDRGFPDAFTTTERFHDCIRQDGHLPLAFADWLESSFATGVSTIDELVRLEVGMARVRRGQDDRSEACAGEVVLASDCLLADSRVGLATEAERLRAALDAGIPAIPLDLKGRATCTLLLRRRALENPFDLAEVEVEELSEAVAGLLRLASSPVGPEARAAYGAELGADAEMVEVFVDDLVSDAVLLRGRS